MNTKSIYHTFIIAGAMSLSQVNLSNAATSITFNNLTTDLISADNDLSASGFNTNDTELSVVGALSGNDYVYTVTYSGSSYDGDATNDTLSFEVLVQAWSDGTITQDFASTDTFITGAGSASIGTTDANVFIGASGFSVGDLNMNPGESVQLSIQNLNVATSTGSYEAVATGFVGVFLAEFNGGFGHNTVIGSSDSTADEIGIRWNNPNNFTTFDTDTDPLFVSAATANGTGSVKERFQVTNFDFGVEINAVPEPSSSAMLLGGLGMLVLRRRRI